MRIDSHQHFWRYNPVEYPWMTDNMAVLRRDQMPQDLEVQLKPLGFEASIAVQARQTVEETDWLLQLANDYPFIKGVVGWADLRSPNLGDQLQRWNTQPKLVGVRHVLQDEPDDRFMLRGDFRRGISQLREFGLTYDLLLFPRHLTPATTLVEEFPDQPFVLDHLGKPAIRDRQISPWRDDFARVAGYPNVVCKLSGMVTEAEWQRWHPDDFRPYLDAAFEFFGPNRLMIGSDWPVCTVSGGYSPTMRIVLNYLAEFAAQDQEAVLGGTCARFYGLDEDG